MSAPTPPNTSQSLPAAAHVRMTIPENVEILTDLEDQLSLDNAAFHGRLPADRLISQEAACFPDIIAAHSATQKLYLYLRNDILQLWLNNVREELTFEQIVESIPSPYNSDQALIYRIYSFLNRYGFINFGIFKYTQELAAKKFRVIVIGAGVAGLMASRQLTRFGFDVTVLEARNRIGGRIATFKRGEFIGDLGAMIVTGLCGNPLTVLARQIPMELKKIRAKCPLYEQNGATITKGMDETVEKEFNNLLDAVSYMAHNLNFTNVHDRPLSLGEALDLAMQLQEKKIRDTHLEFLKTMMEFQTKLKQCLHQLIRYKDCIKRLSDEFKRELTAARSANLYRSSAQNSDDTNESLMLRRLRLLTKRRDLKIALKKYTRLLQHRKLIEEEIRSLDEGKPSETYMIRKERQLLDWHFANLEFANATSLNKLSLKHWDQDDEFELSGSHLSVRNGYAIVSVHLARDLAIRQKMAVKEVHHGPNGVRVVALVDDDGSELKSETFEADAVLCTLPLGVLKYSLTAAENDNTAISFHPPLPEWKENAIRNLGFGNLNKVVLCFDKIFWQPKINVFGCVGNSGAASRGELFQVYLLFWNLYEAPVLIGLLAGDAADLSEQTDDNLLVGRCMHILRGIFGRQIPPKPKDFLVTRWRTDPWSRGSYSFVSTDATGDDYDLLAAPVTPTGAGERTRLFFAGEHTIRNYPATVHGAMISGLREAGRIADEYLGCSYTPSAVPTTLRPQPPPAR